MKRRPDHTCPVCRGEAPQPRDQTRRCPRVAIEEAAEASIRAALVRARLFRGERWLRGLLADGYAARRMVSDADGEFDPDWPTPAAMICRALISAERIAEAATHGPKSQSKMPPPRLQPI